MEATVPFSEEDVFLFSFGYCRGGRYSREEADMKVDVTHFISLDGVARYYGDDRLADFGIDFGTQAKDDWTDWSAKVGLDYQVSDNVLAYGHISRGFKSGGFVGRITIPEDICFPLFRYRTMNYVFDLLSWSFWCSKRYLRWPE